MAFAAAADHLDGDQRTLGELFVPHPERSLLYRLPDHALAGMGLRAGDLVVVERGREPRPGEFALLAVDGAPALRRLDGREPSDGAAEVLLQGTATVLVRTLTR